MLKFSKFRSIQIFIFIVVAPSFFTEVRSDYDSSHIRLPTATNLENDEPASANNPCTGTSIATPPSCPVKCFTTDPVCGADGVTYWCGCAEAMCAGTRVAKLGFCEVGSGGSALLAGQAFLLIHIVWLIVLGFSVLFGLF